MAQSTTSRTTSMDWKTGTHTVENQQVQSTEHWLGGTTTDTHTRTTKTNLVDGSRSVTNVSIRSYSPKSGSRR